MRIYHRSGRPVSHFLLWRRPHRQSLDGIPPTAKPRSFSHRSVGVGSKELRKLPALGPGPRVFVSLGFVSIPPSALLPHDALVRCQHLNSIPLHLL